LCWREPSQGLPGSRACGAGLLGSALVARNLSFKGALEEFSSYTFKIPLRRSKPKNPGGRE